MKKVSGILIILALTSGVASASSAGTDTGSFWDRIVAFLKAKPAAPPPDKDHTSRVANDTTQNPPPCRCAGQQQIYPCTPSDDPPPDRQPQQY